MPQSDKKRIGLSALSDALRGQVRGPGVVENACTNGIRHFIEPDEALLVELFHSLQYRDILNFRKGEISFTELGSRIVSVISDVAFPVGNDEKLQEIEVGLKNLCGGLSLDVSGLRSRVVDTPAYPGEVSPEDTSGNDSMSLHSQETGGGASSAVTSLGQEDETAYDDQTPQTQTPQSDDFLDSWLRVSSRGREEVDALREAAALGALEYQCKLREYGTELLALQPPRICWNGVQPVKAVNNVDVREMCPLAREYGSRVIIVEVKEHLRGKDDRYRRLVTETHRIGKRDYRCCGVAKFEDASEVQGDSEVGRSRVFLMAEPLERESNTSVLLSRFGDFASLCHQPNKLTERLSLLASRCKASMQLEEGSFALQADIAGEDSAIMTDGCGLISISCLAKIAHALGEKADVISAVQIRGFTSLGIFKGILQLSNDLPEGTDIVFLKSMQKVPPSREHNPVYSRLEVKQLYGCHKETLPHHHINRQLIQLYHSVGMPMEVPINLLESEISALRCKIREGLDREMIIRTVPKGSLAHGFLEAGTPLNETVVQASRLKHYRSHLKSLSDKMRIQGSEHARTLVYGAVGLPDHTETLPEGCIFMRPNPQLPPIRGPVVVTRCPCLDPSDLRVLQAIEAPEGLIEHAGNIVLFSTKGNRSEVSYMGNGDYDGDSFFVCINPQIVRPILEWFRIQQAPSSGEMVRQCTARGVDPYVAALSHSESEQHHQEEEEEEEEEEHEEKEEDEEKEEVEKEKDMSWLQRCINIIESRMRNDQFRKDKGITANEYQTLVTLRQNGAKTLHDADVRYLASRHPQALDAVKTGVSPKPLRKVRPDLFRLIQGKFPHFKPKTKKQGTDSGGGEVRSLCILGKLHDIVQKEISLPTNAIMQHSRDPDFLFPHWELANDRVSMAFEHYRATIKHGEQSWESLRLEVRSLLFGKETPELHEYDKPREERYRISAAVYQVCCDPAKQVQQGASYPSTWFIECVKEELLSLKRDQMTKPTVKPRLCPERGERTQDSDTTVVDDGPIQDAVMDADEEDDEDVVLNEVDVEVETEEDQEDQEEEEEEETKEGEGMNALRKRSNVGSDEEVRKKKKQKRFSNLAGQYTMYEMRFQTEKGSMRSSSWVLLIKSGMGSLNQQGGVKEVFFKEDGGRVHGSLEEESKTITITEEVGQRILRFTGEILPEFDIDGWACELVAPESLWMIAPVLDTPCHTINMSLIQKVEQHVDWRGDRNSDMQQRCATESKSNKMSLGRLIEYVNQKDTLYETTWKTKKVTEIHPDLKDEETFQEYFRRKLQIELRGTMTQVKSCGMAPHHMDRSLRQKPRSQIWVHASLVRVYPIGRDSYNDLRMMPRLRARFERKVAYEMITQRLGLPIEAATVRWVTAALTTPAGGNGEEGPERNYKDLETLGDSVLQYVVSKHLFDKGENMNEGELTENRSSCVRNSFLTQKYLNYGINLDAFIDVRLYKSKSSLPEMTGSIQADVIEALIGAAYKSGGLSAARCLIAHFGIIDIDEKCADTICYDEDDARQVSMLNGKAVMTTLAGERLEWLGDAVVGLAIMSYLHEWMPQDQRYGKQAYLSRQKQAAVNNFTLARVAVSLDWHTNIITENKMITTEVNKFVTSCVSEYEWPFDEPSDEIGCLKVLANVFEAQCGLKMQMANEDEQEVVIKDCAKELLSVLEIHGWGGACSGSITEDPVGPVV